MITYLSEDLVDFWLVKVLGGDLEDYFLLSSLIRAFLPARSRR